MIGYKDQTWCSADDCITRECVRNTKFMDEDDYMKWSLSILKEGDTLVPGPMCFSPMWKQCSMYVKEKPVVKVPEPDVHDFTAGTNPPAQGPIDKK